MNEVNQAQHSPDRFELTSEVLGCCNSIDHHLRLSGVEFTPVTQDSLKKWALLDPEKQNLSFQKLKILNQELIDIFRSRVDYRKTSDHLDWFLGKYSLEVDQEFKNTIDNDDIIEVYNSSFEQTFRNFRLLEVSDYDILELNTYDWPELFQRSERVNGLLFDLANRTLNGDLGFSEIEAPSHLMKETLSSSQKTVKVKHRFGCPVYFEGEVAGFACSQKVYETNISI